MDSLSPVECDKCSKLIGFQGSQPRPYMLCPDCNEERERSQLPTPAEGK